MSMHSPQDSPYPRHGQGQGGGQGNAPYGGHGYGPSNYGAPGPVPMYGHAPAPFGYEPSTGIPYSDKSKIAAGILQIFLGTLGIGRFYMGSTGIAVAQLVLTILGWLTTVILIGFLLLPIVAVWALIDGIVILAGRPVDAQGRPLRP